MLDVTKKMTTQQFMDVRNHGFFRVAVFSPVVHLGNPQVCADEHHRIIRQLANEGVQYAMGPELGLGGYSLGDLHHQQLMSQLNEAALKHLVERTRDLPMLITVGVGLVIGYMPFNCEVTFCKGRIRKVGLKEYLPNEGEFYEERHWADSDMALPEQINLCGQDNVPVGDNILVRCAAHPGVIIYNPVCEADWPPVTMSGFAALAGATIIGNVSASNITIGKDEWRQTLFGGSSGRLNAAYLYSSAGFGESTSDHAWDGEIFIAFRGSIKEHGERYGTGGSCVVSDIDINMLMADRKRQHSFRANAKKWKQVIKTLREVVLTEELGCNHSGVVYNSIHDVEISRTPFVPITSTQREKRCHEVFSMQKTSLMRRLSGFPVELRHIWLGLSGGADSTHALNIAVDVMDALGLPRTNVHVVTMPGFGTGKRTKKNAIALAKAYGVSLMEISINESSQLRFDTIGFTVDSTLKKQPVVYENVQAWERTMDLLSLAAHHGGFVLGTGDLSEAAQGWCTLFGDFPLHYGINAGVAKTLILYLIGYAKDVVFKNEPEVQTVLQDILETDISPELQPVSEVEGEMAQKTEDLIGPYILHDFFLYYFVRFGFTPVRILRMAVQAFDGLYDYATIKLWLGRFLRRFFANQYKRNMMSDGPKIGLVSLNPRGDWRMPSDADVSAWIQNLETAPDTL